MVKHICLVGGLALLMAMVLGRQVQKDMDALYPEGRSYLSEEWMSGGRALNEVIDQNYYDYLKELKEPAGLLMGRPGEGGRYADTD